MIMLMIGVSLFLGLAPVGRQLIENLDVGLVMDFATTTLDEVSESWMGLCVILVLIGSCLGLSEGWFGAVVGFILGVLIYALICFCWMVLVNYVFPLVVNVGALVSVGVICLAFALGCSVAIVNYVKNFILYFDPYPSTPGVYDDGVRSYYEDTSKNREEYGRRSYFFGPGYFSIIETIKNSWSANFQLIGNVCEWLGDHTNGLGEWLCWIPGVPYLVFFTVSIVAVGGVVTTICSLIHGGIVMLIMAVIYVIFGVVWLLDRLMLIMRKTISVCGACKESYLIPMFVCPDCGKRHRHLVPGVYGILYHQCACGKKLPATFLTGRAGLTACCPHCSTDTYIQKLENDVRPVSIQLVGGINSGKSVYLASALTCMQEELAMRGSTRVKPSDVGLMNGLRRMYETGTNSNTTETNAIMYSLRVHSPFFEPDRLMSIFDIAGEFFIRPESASMPQLQLRNVDGIVMLIDILSLYTADEMSALDARVSCHRSMAKNVDVLNGLVEHMNLVGAKRRNGRFTVPFYVVISKLDTVNELMRKISIDDALMDLITAFVPGGEYPQTAEKRDKLCHDFILSRDEVNLLELIKQNFCTVHYYAASATGGEMITGQSFQPWPGMMAPIEDVVSSADTELYALMKNGGVK